jgi:hypothetical protein
VNSERIILIRVVSAGLQSNRPRNRIIEQLKDSGVPPEAAEDVFQRIEQGLKAGVASAVSHGWSAIQRGRGQDTLYDSAFDAGVLEFRKQLFLIRLKRWALPIAIVTAVGILLFLYFKK